MSNEQKPKQKPLVELMLLLVVMAIIMNVVYLSLKPTDQGQQKQGATPPSPPMRPPMMGSAPSEDNADQQAKIEAAMKALEPKFQALNEAMEPLMTGKQEPSPEQQKIGMLMMQAMQCSQVVRMLAMTDSPRAQKRLEGGLFIMQDALDEAYEEAQSAGLITELK